MQVAARVLLLVEARHYGIFYVCHPTMCSTIQRFIADERSQNDQGKPTQHLYASWYVGEGLKVDGPRTS